jgi:cyanate permease
MNFVPYLVSWALLAVTVLALFVWRKTVAIGEDDNLHVTGGASVEKNAAQSAVAQKLELIDRWGKIATVVTIIYGLILGGIYMWMGWVQNRYTGA